MEATGTIVATGTAVREFGVGDNVIVHVPGTFRTYLTVSENFLKRKSEQISFPESLFYVSFVTAYYGLVEIARLKKGEKVLIHSAAGGVGLAAVQIAQGIGAEIYATAGSEEKREYLRSLGIEYVMDSRSLRFASQIRRKTSGRGVDVVLNSLVGEALQQSLSCLAPFG